MAVSLASFRAQFPEFDLLEDAHATAHLNAQDGLIASDINEHVRDQLVYLATADSLASTQWGYNARLSQPGQMTAYKAKYEELMWRTSRRGLVVYGSGTSTSGL